MDELTADAIYQELSEINSNIAKLLEAQNKTNEYLDNLIAATRANRPEPQLPEHLRNPQR